MIYTLFEVLFCIVEFICCDLLLSAYCKERVYKVPFIKPMSLFTFGILEYMFTFNEWPTIVTTTICIILTVIYGICIYKGNIGIKIVLGTCFLLVEGTITYSLLNLIAFVLKQSLTILISYNTLQRIVVISLVKLIIFIVIMFIRYIKMQFITEISSRYRYSILFVFICSFICMQVIFEMSLLNKNPTFGRFIFFILVIFIIFNVVILILVNKISIYIKEKATHDIIGNSQVYLQKTIFEVEKRQQEIRKIKHDILNHYGVLEYLIKDGSIEESLTYIEGLKSKIQSTAIYYKTGNSIADAVINQKIELGKSYNIKFEVSAVIPEDLQIDSVDLGTILFNLLDNAIEAAQEVQASDRKISINIHPHNNVLLLIDLSNAVRENPIKEGVLIRRKKDNYSEHGYGMKSVEYIVSKYNGYMQYKCHNEMFNIVVLMKYREIGCAIWTKNRTTQT